MADRELTYDQWVQEFEPETTDDSSLVQYPVWGSVPRAVIAENRAWAVIEGEDRHTCAAGEFCTDDECEDMVSQWAIMPGYHLVNVVYFTVTAKPATDVSWVDWED